MMINAIIPIQYISSELSNKEFREINGHPMFYWAIRAALLCEQIDKVYISTHFSLAYQQISNYFLGIGKVDRMWGGAKIEFLKRPLELHGEVELLDVMQHAERELQDSSHPKSMGDKDIFIQIQVNKPLTTEIDLTRYVTSFLSCDLSSLFQVQRIRTAVNWEYKKSRRQGTPNFKSCAIAKMWDRKTLRDAEDGTWGKGEHHLDIIVPNWHTEIDSEEDFKIAEILMKAEVNKYG